MGGNFNPNPTKNSGRGISNFRISWQSFIKENCHKSRTSNNTDIKLGPVNKLDKRNKTSSNNFNAGVMSANYDVIVIFLIFGQSGPIGKLDSGDIVCRTYIFININLKISQKLSTELKKTLKQPSYYCFEYRYYFWQKMLIFYKKMLTSAKLTGPSN